LNGGKIEADLSSEVIDRPDPWLPAKSAFAGFQFPPEVIVVAVALVSTLQFVLSGR
jgi:hypothetical protein